MEDYKKKYEEALERARKWAENPTVWSSDDICQKIFPELAESEDEKIRKEIIEYFKKYNAISLGGFSTVECISWLEKQKPAECSLEQAAEIFLDSLAKTPYNNKPVTDAQVITKELLKFLSDTNSYNPDALIEQKPVEMSNDYDRGYRDGVSAEKYNNKWSDEDEKIRDGLIDMFTNQRIVSVPYGMKSKDIVQWLNSLKNRMQPHSNQDWSEDDEYNLSTIIGSIYYDDRKNEVEKLEQSNWLKSLKPQHQ